MTNPLAEGPAFPSLGATVIGQLPRLQVNERGVCRCAVSQRPLGWIPLKGESREAGSRYLFHWFGENSGRPGGPPWVRGAGRELSSWSASHRPPGPGCPRDPRHPNLSGMTDPSLPLEWGAVAWRGGGCPPFPDIGLSPRVVQPGVPGARPLRWCRGARARPDWGSAHRSDGHSVCRGPREGKALVPHPQEPKIGPVTGSSDLRTVVCPWKVGKGVETPLSWEQFSR